MLLPKLWFKIMLWCINDEIVNEIIQTAIQSDDFHIKVKILKTWHHYPMYKPQSSQQIQNVLTHTIVGITNKLFDLNIHFI